jgi:TRAP transporter TAXI family solute receptor
MQPDNNDSVAPRLVEFHVENGQPPREEKMKNQRQSGIGAIIGATAMVAATWVPAAQAAEKLPNTILLGTQQPGSLQHTMATGLAKIATKGVGVPVIVRPHSGSSTHIPLLNAGELDFNVAPSVDAGMSFQGKERLKIGGKNPYPRAQKLRLVMSGSPLLAGLIVRNDSPIKSAKDLKGRRIAGGFPSGLGAYINMYVHLKGANLTWADAKVVPFGSLNDSLNALVQGRVDATVYGIGAPRVREADARVGIRFIDDDCSPEGKKRILGAAPGYFTVNLKPGRLPGVRSNICVTAFVIYLMASEKTSDVIVTAVLKALWDGSKELQKLHPGLRRWKRATAVSARPTVPYHKAAIAFFKTKGVWTAKAEAAHQKLLAAAK